MPWKPSRQVQLYWLTISLQVPLFIQGLLSHSKMSGNYLNEMSISPVVWQGRAGQGRAGQGRAGQAVEMKKIRSLAALARMLSTSR